MKEYQEPKIIKAALYQESSHKLQHYPPQQDSTDLDYYDDSQFQEFPTFESFRIS